MANPARLLRVASLALLTLSGSAGLGAQTLGSVGTHPRAPVQPDLSWDLAEFRLSGFGDVQIAWDAHRQVVVALWAHPNYGHIVYEWDGTRWEERRGVTRPLPRLRPGWAYCPVRKTTIMFGGFDYRDHRVTGRTHAELNDTWEWDGQDWRLIVTQNSPPPRFRHTMQTDPERKEIVMYGGSRLNLVTWAKDFDLRTWIWDGNDWSVRNTAHNPNQREVAAMCFNPLNKRMTLFGGMHDAPFAKADNEIWEWTGSDWYRNPQANRPTNDGNPAFAFDPVSRKIILQHVDRRYIWAWDGVAWALVNNNAREFNASGPLGHTTDWARGQMILAGPGGQKAPTYGMETYTISQGDWKLLDKAPYVAGRPYLIAPFHSQLAHDPSRDELVMLSYRGDAPNYNKDLKLHMWVKRGRSWHRIHPKTEPPPRKAAGLIYHASLGKIVLMGGNLIQPSNGWSIGPAQDIWVWDGVDWAQHPHSGATGGPPHTGNGFIVYDWANDRVMYAPGRLDKGRVWFWDHRQGWSSVMPANPLADRGPFRLVYDRFRDTVVFQDQKLLGGTRAEAWFYEWRNNDWARVPNASVPPLNYWIGAFSAEAGGVVYAPMDGTLSDWSRRRGILVGQGGWQYLPSSQNWTVFRASGTSDPGGPLQGREMVYDTGRRQLNAIHRAAPFDHVFAQRNLFADTLYPRPGGSVNFTAIYPGSNSSFWLALSTSEWPGIPLYTDPQLGPQLLPLGMSGLLTHSIHAALVRQLDSQGRARFSIPLPQDPNLVGLEVFAAGIKFGAAGIEDISNMVDLRISR